MPVAKPMDYEDRDDIINGIMELVDKRISSFQFEWKIENNKFQLLPVDEFWSDELLNKIDDLFERYTTGTWRNYN